MNDEYELGSDEQAQGMQVAVREPVQPVERMAAPVQESKPTVTPAQAKVDAIADLTAAAYARASQLFLTADEIKGLQAEFPDEAFKAGAAGKENLIYIEHAFLRDRLNGVIGPGQWALIPRSRWGEDFSHNKQVNGQWRTVSGTRIYVEAMLMVRGCFVAEAVGEMEYYPNNLGANYGDAVEGAKTAALRRCCKEFGIGLQAWKKDWCEGWWARKRAGDRKPASYTPQAKETPKKADSAPAKANHEKPGAPEACKKRLLDLIAEENAGEVWHEWAVKAAVLLPNESLADWPLDAVPTTKDQFAALQNQIRLFCDGERAELPFPRNAEALAPAKAKAASATPPNVGTKHQVGTDDAQEQPWYPFVVPIPHKNQKRDDYLKAPDTIGSLYESRHGTDDLAQEARQRLWGFVTNYEPKGWEKRDGTKMPPSETDIRFREMLNQFADWFEKHHPDEKL